jgi:transmembrane sensor
MSSQESSAQTRERLEQEAVAWYARWASGEFTAEELAQFDAWKTQSPAHEKADRKIQRLWQLLPAALTHDEAIGVDVPQSTAATVIPFKTADQITQKSRSKSPVLRIASWGLGLATAASLLLGICISYCGGYLDNPWADHHTLVGEQSTLNLSDGSTVFLNTDTALDVSMSDGERRIVLLRGEAEFAVAHDSNRPFRVVTGHTTTEALGTRFVVRYTHSAGDVTLLEGKVRTTRSNHHGDTLSQVVLKPGEHVAFNENQLGDVQTADVSVADAWRRGRLVMNFVALQDVVNEINRYRPGHVFLVDSQLAQRKIHVAMDIKRIDDWLDALQDTLPIKVHHAGHILVLQAR